MHKVTASLLGILASFGASADTEVGTYAAGQIWSYKTRSGEENSKITITKIDQDVSEKIIHISVSDIKNISPSKEQTIIPHIPMTKKAMDESVIALLGTTDDLPNYQQGYAIWKKAFDKHEAGVFAIPVSEVIQNMETTVNEAPK